MSEQQQAQGQEPTAEHAHDNTEQQAQQQPAPDTTPEVDQDAQQQPETFDREYVEKLRKEAAANRTRAKEHEEAVAAAQAEKDELIREFGKRLGFIKDEDTEQADAQALMEQLTAERDAKAKELADLRSELALKDAATAVNADTDLLIPYLRGTGALADLDPAADDYNAQVADVVKQAVESNPKLATQAVPRSSSVDSTNPNPAGRKLTQDDLARLYAEGKYEEINKAAASGLIS